MSGPLTYAQIRNSLLSGLNNLFDNEYAKTRRPTYMMKPSYGKFNIYKTEYSIEFDRPHTTTLAKRVDKETAIGMMKLLENEYE